MTLPGKTASRFLLSAARVVLSNEEFTNGYLPDFRGNKSGRVPIPQEAVDKLRGCRIHLLASIHRNYFFSNRSCSDAFCLQRGGYGEYLDNDSNQSRSKSQRCPQEQQTAKPSARSRAAFRDALRARRRFGRSVQQQRRGANHQPKLKMVRLLLDEIENVQSCFRL